MITDTTPRYVVLQRYVVHAATTRGWFESTEAPSAPLLEAP